jgi:hypothetical protein
VSNPVHLSGHTNVDVERLAGSNVIDLEAQRRWRHVAQAVATRPRGRRLAPVGVRLPPHRL